MRKGCESSRATFWWWGAARFPTRNRQRMSASCIPSCHRHGVCTGRGIVASRPVTGNACLPVAFPVALSTGSAPAGVLLLPVYLRMHQLELACPRKLVSIGTYVGSTKANMTRVRPCPPAIRSWWIAYPLSGYVRGSSDESPRNLGWHHTSQMRIQLLCTGSHGLVMVAFQWRLVPFPYPREFPRTLFHGKATDESTN